LHIRDDSVEKAHTLGCGSLYGMITGNMITFANLTLLTTKLDCNFYAH
jgi:hypothetical protein